VRCALAALDGDSFQALESEWRKSNPEEVATRELVTRYYEAVIIEEIVRRAGVAAYRTTEW
jgi:hypothetical protein